MKSRSFSYRELGRGDDFSIIYKLSNLLAPDLTKKQFEERLAAMLERDYRCLVAFDGDTPVAMAAWWIHYQFWSGKFMEIDNVVVDPAYRGDGLGSILMEKLEKKAKAQGCELTLLKVYAFNRGAQRFYFQNGYMMPGQVFVKPLHHEASEWSAKIGSRYQS